jgi:hypothetical protein
VIAEGAPCFAPGLMHSAARFGVERLKAEASCVWAALRPAKRLIHLVLVSGRRAPDALPIQ